MVALASPVAAPRLLCRAPCSFIRVRGPLLSICRSASPQLEKRLLRLLSISPDGLRFDFHIAGGGLPTLSSCATIVILSIIFRSSSVSWSKPKTPPPCQPPPPPRSRFRFCSCRPPPRLSALWPFPALSLPPFCFPLPFRLLRARSQASPLPPLPPLPQSCCRPPSLKTRCHRSVAVGNSAGPRSLLACPHSKRPQQRMQRAAAGTSGSAPRSPPGRRSGPHRRPAGRRRRWRPGRRPPTAAAVRSG
mmetsp:Transcript_36291/g.93761  ORF Transcript_36291/g.93761 Transcript_36291/m.93761 type:complete len:247 (+) Transcript_36291:38-778(+)